jgi:hypothetical protein
MSPEELVKRIRTAKGEIDAANELLEIMENEPANDENKKTVTKISQIKKVIAKKENQIRLYDFLINKKLSA